MIVTLLTDFGTADPYVGVMKGVVLGVDASVPLVDLTHEVPPGRVDVGAFHLLVSYRHFPAGTVHVAVVDPGVGSERRPIVVEAAGQCFVAPDNGLLSYLLETEEGAVCREVTSPRFLDRPLSTTFHGRDLFAPVGAALATGTPASELGAVIDDPVRLPSLRPSREVNGALVGRVLHVDRFGNCITSLPRAGMFEEGERLALEIGGRRVEQLRAHYAGAPEGEPFLVWGSAGFLEVSVNGGSAAAVLGVGTGAVVRLHTGPSAVHEETSR